MMVPVLDCRVLFKSRISHPLFISFRTIWSLFLAWTVGYRGSVECPVIHVIQDAITYASRYLLCYKNKDAILWSVDTISLELLALFWLPSVSAELGHSWHYDFFTSLGDKSWFIRSSYICYSDWFLTLKIVCPWWFSSFNTALWTFMYVSIALCLPEKVVKVPCIE